MSKRDFEYDVCLPFAGEQREYVEQVAAKLKSRGVRVFFDDYAKAVLWGKDLYSRTTSISISVGTASSLLLKNMPTRCGQVTRMEQVVGMGEGRGQLKHTDPHAYRMQVTVISN